MTALGTDLVAWACIVGSAAASGGLTLAFLGDTESHVPMECEVEVQSEGQHLVVSNHGRAVVMRVPNVSTRLNQKCGSVLSGHVLLHDGVDAEEIRLHVEDLRREVEGARVHIEMSRAEGELAREMGRVVRMQRRRGRAFPEDARERMQEAQAQMEAALERVTEAEAEASEGLQEIKVIVKKAGAGSGGG